MKIVKPTNKINLVTDSKEVKQSLNRRSDINAVKNLPSFGASDTSDSEEGFKQHPKQENKIPRSSPRSKKVLEM